MDCEAPSTSTCKTNEQLDRLYKNGGYENQQGDAELDICNYYYMWEDSHEDVLIQLEGELQKEEIEAQNKAESTERIVKELEKNAKDFDELCKMVKQWNNEKAVRDERKAEKLRVIELRRQLAIENKNVSMFCCFVCSKVFTDEEGMRQHVSDVHLATKKEYKYKCPKCFRRFVTYQHLERHLETHSHVLLTCAVCKREFKEAISVEVHMSKVHGLSIHGVKIEKTHQCRACGKAFGVSEELRRHKWYCGSKEQIAERRRKARQELDAMSAVSQDSSARSVASSETASTLSIGSSSGRPVKDKSCPYCFLVCASMQSRRRHIERKHPEKVGEPETDQHTYVKVLSATLPYACEQCCKTFATHSSLSIHRRRVHEDRNDHVCPTCSRRYPLGSELRKHIRRVHEKDSS